MMNLPHFERVTQGAIAEQAGNAPPIQAWREYRKMTTQDLADAMRVSVDELVALESAPASDIDPDKLRHVAAVLNVDIEDLIVRSQCWEVRRQGRRWEGEEIRQKYNGLPEEKPELWRGQVYWSDEARLYWLACLLEQCGADAAVRIGDPDVWRAAVEALGHD